RIDRGVRGPPSSRAPDGGVPQRGHLRAPRRGGPAAALHGAFPEPAPDPPAHLRLKGEGIPMCGIVGYVGSGEAVPILLAGLPRLEYRGYDSAGIAVHTRGGLKVHKAAGKITRLESALPRRMKGTVGIGHTRWATHGEPNDGNAHPHSDCAG